MATVSHNTISTLEYDASDTDSVNSEPFQVEYILELLRNKDYHQIHKLYKHGMFEPGSIFPYEEDPDELYDLVKAAMESKNRDLITLTLQQLVFHEDMKREVSLYVYLSILKWIIQSEVLDESFAVFANSRMRGNLLEKDEDIYATQLRNFFLDTVKSYRWFALARELVERETNPCFWGAYTGAIISNNLHGVLYPSLTRDQVFDHLKQGLGTVYKSDVYTNGIAAHLEALESNDISAHVDDRYLCELRRLMIPRPVLRMARSLGFEKFVELHDSTAQ